MAEDKKISQLTVASALTGTETLEVVQGGVNKQTTTQDIADLGGGGGAVSSVFSRTGAVTSQAGDYTATQVTNTPAGGIAATTVQAALNELDTEKAPLASPTFTGTPTVPGYQALVNAAVVLTDAATIDLTAIKHTLATSAATRTFTISYTGDDITMEVTLSAATATYTFPATSLCVSEGTASGDNTCVLNGVSGDKYMFAIKKVGSAYYVVVKNFGQ